MFLLQIGACLCVWASFCSNESDIITGWWSCLYTPGVCFQDKHDGQQLTLEFCQSWCKTNNLTMKHLIQGVGVDYSLLFMLHVVNYSISMDGKDSINRMIEWAGSVIGLVGVSWGHRWEEKLKLVLSCNNRPFHSLLGSWKLIQWAASDAWVLHWMTEKVFCSSSTQIF